MCDELKVSAYDELSLVQSIISAQEEICFKYFGWALGLITVLSIGFAHKSVLISPCAYFSSSMGMLISCFLAAKVHWDAHQRAIDRSQKIEEEIKKGKYGGFKINSSLKEKSTGKLKLRFYLPYLGLALVVILFACLVSS